MASQRPLVGKVYQVHTALHGYPAAYHRGTIIESVGIRRWRVRIPLDGRQVTCTVRQGSIGPLLGEGDLSTEERRNLANLSPVWM